MDESSGSTRGDPGLGPPIADCHLAPSLFRFHSSAFHLSTGFRAAVTSSGRQMGVAIVHAETSTGVRQPLEEISRIAHGCGALPKYSIGVGDRFSQQGCAQLDAIILARRQRVDIAPVWNKSHREHTITGSLDQRHIRPLFLGQ